MCQQNLKIQLTLILAQSTHYNTWEKNALWPVSRVWCISSKNFFNSSLPVRTSSFASCISHLNGFCFLDLTLQCSFHSTLKFDPFELTNHFYQGPWAKLFRNSSRGRGRGLDFWPLFDFALITTLNILWNAQWVILHWFGSFSGIFQRLNWINFVPF